MSILDSQVTIFKTVKDVENPYYLTIGQALERIRNGKSKNIVTTIRQGSKENKTELPVVLWAGEFTGRKDTDIFSHSGLVILDFDHVDVVYAKKSLCTDQFILSCWISPSGDGVKALLRITNTERHREHFNAAVSYFEKEYGLMLDPTGANIARACFESYDPDICIKEAVAFGAMISEKEREEATQRVVIEEATDYQRLNVAALIIRKAPDGQKHNALLRAAVLCGGYIASGKMEEEEVVRVLTREISKRDIDSLEHAKMTIRDGIEKGKEMPIHELVETEEKAKRDMQIMDGDMSFISSDDSDIKWIMDYVDGKIPVGLTTGCEPLDKFFRYKKDFTIINGHSNIGKTTMALYMMVNASMHHNWRWILYSSENKTASIKMKLMQFAMDMNIQEMNREQITLAAKWVNEHFIVMRNDKVLSYTELLIRAEKLLRTQQIDGLFIDPYNSLRVEISRSSGVGVHEYHYDAASEFLTFSNNHNIALGLSTHAVTESQRRKGSDGFPVAPDSADSEHGGKWVNRADCFLTFHRKIQHENAQMRRTMEFHVRKIRETESGGEPTSYDSPVLFEMNSSKTAFRHQMGSVLFRPLHYISKGKQQNIDLTTFSIDPKDAF